MTTPQFAMAAYRELDKVNHDEYTNARYAPTGDQKVGTPFPLFRQPAAYFTDYTPSGQSMSNLKKQMNLPTNNTLFRNAQESDGVNLQNTQNTAWMYRTQTLANNGDPIACRNNTDCASWPGTTCNPQFQSWNDAKGNQGNYCSKTEYPELASGIFDRKDATQGGIGKACTSDGECGTGYFCNNTTDMFGKNVQQTGYCSQLYNCPDGQHFVGYPYNSGIPIVPPKNQNNNGRGYNSEAECTSNKLAQQDCKKDMSGKWFAVYPGYCPVPTNQRQGNSPLGALPSSNMSAIDGGIKIPAYATNAASSITKPARAFTAWNINADVSNLQQMSDPLAYELSINPN